MFWFKHKSQIAALEQRISDLEQRMVELEASQQGVEAFVHSDAFHELIESKFDESKFDDLAQEAVERCVENADLRISVRF
jgi:hypothetical protein